MTFPPAVLIKPALPPAPALLGTSTHPIEIVSGRSWERYWQVVWSKPDKPIDASSWGVRFVLRRTIDGDPLIDLSETDGALSWSASATAWRLYLSPTVTAGLAPVSYPTLRPHRYERMIYDLEMTPDAWDLPMDPRPFTIAGGPAYVYKGG